jgi:hypothetical protein
VYMSVSLIHCLIPLRYVGTRNCHVKQWPAYVKFTVKSFNLPADRERRTLSYSDCMEEGVVRITRECGPPRVNVVYKFTLQQVMKAQRGSRGKAVLFSLDGSGWSALRGIHLQETGWASRLIQTCAENLALADIRSPDRPLCWFNIP